MPLVRKDIKECIRDDYTNKILLLYIINKLNESGRVDGWKLQKTCFFTEDYMQEKGIKGLNYGFFVWDHGSMSKEVYRDLISLRESGFLSGEKLVSVTKSGKEFLEDITPLFEINEPIMEYIDSIVDICKQYSGRFLREFNHRYKVKINNKEMTIDDLPKGTQLLDPILEDNVKLSFNIDNATLDTLDILFDKEEREFLLKEAKKFKKEELLSFNEVFRGLE